ncbi:MAG: hypothetical protein WBO24_12195 [Nitrospirales bacterium]
MLLKNKGILFIACVFACFSCASPNQYAEPIDKLETATNIITLEVTKARFGRSLELTREQAYLFAWIVVCTQTEQIPNSLKVRMD